jgi:hypothetical protein
MFGERHLTLALTPGAQQWIEDYKARSGLKNPIPTFHWSRVRGEPQEQLMIGLYERENVREGWLGIADAFQFVVIQEWLFDRLDGKTLDVAYDAEGRLRISVTP